MKTIKSILEESKKLKKEVSDAVLKRKEELYVELKKKRKEFEDRYGEDADKVMHATAMNMAKKEMSEEELQRRTMKDFEDHTPKEDDPAAYHKLVTKSGKRIADKDELDEALRGRDYEYDEKEGVVKISKKNFAKVRKDAKGTIDQKKNPTMMVLTKKGTSLVPVKFTEEVELDEANLKTVEKDVKKILSKVRINNKVSKQGNKFVVTITPDDEKDAQKALKNHPLYVAGKLRVMTEEKLLELTSAEKKLVNQMYDKKGNLTPFGKKVMDHGKKKAGIKEEELGEGTWAFPSNSREIKKAKDFMKKPFALGKNGDDASSALYNIFGDDDLHDALVAAGKKNPKGDARVVVQKWLKNFASKEFSKPSDSKDAKNVAKQLGIKEEVELDEALSSSLIKKLKKQYEPLRDKKVSLDNLKKMSSMIEKFGKDELIQLVKADIPFISQSAHTALMYKHNMSVSQIKKMKNEKVRFEDLVKKAANNLSELNWLVDLEGIGKVVIDGSSKGEVLSSLRKKMKNVDDIGDIERMTDTDKKKYFKMKYATVGKKEPEDKEIKEALDKELVTELSMFILNDAHIYKRRILPVIKNMKRKVASGKFDKKLAIKAFSYAVTDGIKKYSQTFDVVKPSKQDKEEIAKTLYDHYQTAIMEFDDKYKEIYNKLNEDNQERIDFMLNDDKEYDKVLEFVSQFQ